MVTVPQPLACDGQVTFDPATRSLLVKAVGVGGMYWRQGHAALMRSQSPANVLEFSLAAPEVWANGARGEPLPGGWLRFKVTTRRIGSWRAKAWARSSLLTNGLSKSWVCGSAGVKRESLSAA